MSCTLFCRLKQQSKLSLHHYADHRPSWPGQHHWSREGRSVVKVGSVVGVINLNLALLGQLKGQQVRWEVILGLGLVEVFLVKRITSNPSRVQGQHDQRIILDAEGSNVMANLLTITSLVLVLH